MVARKFLLRYVDSDLDVDYDTDDGLEVFKFQVFSLTSIPPDDQKIFGGEDGRLVLDDADLASVSNRLRLTSIHTDEVRVEENSSDQNVELTTSDEELARMLQAEEEARVFQHFVAGEDKSQIETKIRSYLPQVLMYEDPTRQDAARKTVPVEKLKEKALVALAKVGNFKPTESEEGHSFLLQLLFWFKQSFRWVDAPSCDSCGSETVSSGMGTALSSETLYGASRVELYCCTICSRVTRFPRYNDPSKLLETRSGRCGEWANCFTLYCRAFGYESRLMVSEFNDLRQDLVIFSDQALHISCASSSIKHLIKYLFQLIFLFVIGDKPTILDFTDHVWTECFSPSLERWMHLDPCEAIYDNPLLYEKGWKKKLSYAIAIAKDGVYDVTKRYTRKWHEVLSRRANTSENILSIILSNIRRECRQNLASQAIAALEERDRNEAEALKRDLLSKDDDSISLPGRQSGDKEWRISRSEFGSDEIFSPNSSSCPVRKCVDEHVTKIYNAFSPIISKFVEKSCSRSRVVEVLQIFRRILVDLKNSPFRMRKTSINFASDGAQYVLHQMLPSFGQLFDALSLKCDSDSNGRGDIYLADDPVKTSIALPVLFHALDDVMHNVNVWYNSNKDLFSWPLLKLNRICSGLVLASGEEFPFGIATSAFDGTRLSKWEEPNGARGCWIIYRILDHKMHELVSYELMSANDVPERDPRDWVLEGSDDGGSSWRLLDKQISQMFKNRFERKGFKIGPVGFLANAFRFRFLAVRDAKQNKRLQLGSIDLYARTSYSSSDEEKMV